MNFRKRWKEHAASPGQRGPISKVPTREKARREQAAGAGTPEATHVENGVRPDRRGALSGETLANMISLLL